MGWVNLFKNGLGSFDLSSFADWTKYKMEMVSVMSLLYYWARQDLFHSGLE